jgi:hypothetical protein
MPELSLSSSNSALPLPDFDPEHIERVLKIGLNSLQGCVTSQTGLISRFRELAKAHF